MKQVSRVVYNPEHAEKLPELFSHGESEVEVCVVLGITLEDFFNWVKGFPEFAEAYAEGLKLAQAWWMCLGRAGAAGKISVNTTLWNTIVEKRFKMGGK